MRMKTSWFREATIGGVGGGIRFLVVYFEAGLATTSLHTPPPPFRAHTHSSLCLGHRDPFLLLIGVSTCHWPVFHFIS